MPIFFCGDITIDNFEFYGEFAPRFPDALASKTNASIERRGSHAPDKVIVRQLGGTYLLARFTGVAWSLWYGTNKQKKREPARLESWRQFYHTCLKSRQEELFKQPREFDCNWQLSYRLQKFKDDRFRVAPTAYEGFTLPLDLRKPYFVGLKELKLPTSSKETLFVLNVVSDRGEYEKLGKDLADAIANEKGCWVVMKIIDPPKADASPIPLMATLLKEREDRVIGVIPADELRRSGVPISRALSWERTLSDVINHVKRDGLLPGNTPPNLVITFDYDAVLYLKTTAVNGTADKRKVEAGDLIFSIEGAEGEFASTIEGTMPGAESVFVSALSVLLHKEVDRVAASGKTAGSPLANIRHLLACALIAKRRFLQAGFANTGSGLPFEFETTTIGNNTPRRMPRLHFSEGIFSHLEASSPQNASVAPDPFILDERKIEQRTFHDPLELTVAQTLQKHKLAHHQIVPEQLPGKCFSMFERVAGNKHLSDFSDYVLKERAPEGVPICKFGKIKTADVQEIEQLRTVGKLLQSYLSHPSGSRKPVGIAVFGPPGAGKSTALKSILENLPKACKELVQDVRHECNLAAMAEPEDLAHYFQLARDAALRGKVPILFFDEFDCAVHGAEYFWLKHFLAPLQDGEFRSGHIVYPIGRAIFVFAGGVSSTFCEFEKAMSKGSSGAISDGRAQLGSVNFKGVDFLSRLNGHIDVLGLSPSKDEKDAFYASHTEQFVIDPSYLMRRAFVLRTLLQFNAPKIFSQGSPQEAQIDGRIVDALLLTNTFKHGTRSMEAIIRMSCVEGMDRFELSHLPPDGQLDMHVDSRNLRHCLARGAQAIWNDYVTYRPPVSP